MIKSIEKAFRLLEILSDSDEPMRLRDISAQGEITRSNAVRLLQTMRDLGYVRQLENSTSYELTSRCFEIGARKMASDSLVTVAHPVLQHLAEMVPHNILLSVRDGLSSVVLDRIESRSFVRTFAYLGARAPLHVVSGGKVLLAYASDSVIDEATRNLTRFTENTITDRARLHSELALIRERGYAIAIKEINDAAQGIAVPVRSRFGDVAAALGVSGPFGDIDQPMIDRMVALLSEHATRIEAAWFGGSQPKAPASVPRPSSA